MFASLYSPAFQGGKSLAALAFEFSPTVEQTAPDTVTFDVSGLERLFGLPQDVAGAISRRVQQIGLQANLALAANPDAAICAARGFLGTHILPQGDEAKFLGRLPLTLLAPSPELQETLERWGIRRFQDLAALPALGIAERLGPEGLRLRQLARGEVARKLVPLEEPLRFADEIELEYPIELLEPLLFVLSRLLNGIFTRLATRGLATNEMHLRLGLENRATHHRTLRLPVPSLDRRAFLKLLQLDLEAHSPEAPVIFIALEANSVKPQAAQTGLFMPQAPEPVKLQLTLARIQAIVGEGRVGSPQLIDTHRPGAFRMASFSEHAAVKSGEQAQVRLALRMFRPPLPACVRMEARGPGFVAARGIRGKVLKWAGPWRTSGDWWTSDPWSRDEWDIALSDGALYLIFREPRGWFVEGSYD